MIDIQAELAGLFATQDSGVSLPSGSLAGQLADLFGDDNGEQEKRAAKRKEYERELSGEKRIPKTVDEKRETQKLKKRRQRAKKKADALEHIAVLDMETDPFDAATRERIFPFTACLYSDQFQPIIIWEENETAFVDKLISTIEALPGEYTIYAHNGGKFDFLFLINRLRGRVSFKGRGIMSATIGNHELRDSYHIIPEKLAAYKKDEMDYEKMRKSRRNNHKQEIIDYLISDCVYLFDIVKTFLQNYGFKISIGQAAMHLLKKEYPECENITASEDEFARRFFFGGRVECIEGCGEFVGDYKLYDVNSMYPYVMANYRHPIGKRYIPRKGRPNDDTCFIDLECYSAGAFAVKKEGEGTSFPHEFGRYQVTIHEYKVAKKYGLIKRENILYCVDNEKFTSFDRFILPLYNNRLLSKAKLKQLAKDGKTESEEYTETKKDDIFFKLLQNNAYGKFAQNPRRFKEFYLTDYDKRPDDEPETWGEFPSEQCSDYAIWSRPIQKLRFNNVGTAASITGGARAILLEAKINAIDPIYCDTDSLICKELKGWIDPVKLGAWDIEAEMSHVMIAGKKLYSYRKIDGKEIIKSKGVRGTTWQDIQTLVEGGEIVIGAFAPTLTKTGNQTYIDRRIRATTTRKA